MGKILLISVILVFGLIRDVFADNQWQELSSGNSDVKTVLTHPHNQHIIYFGSKGGVYKSQDSGLSWRNMLSVKGNNRAVNFLSFDPLNLDSLYAATGSGLFYSDNQGRNWKRIFRGKGYPESGCTVLAVSADIIYLGTQAGLFISKDKARSWNREAGQIGKDKILAVACNPKEPDYIYVAALGGVFKSQDSGQTWERVFVAIPVENGSDGEEAVAERDEEERFSDIRYLIADPNNAACLYLATSKGVYKTGDRGLSWDLLSDYGLLSREVRFLLASREGALYAATKSGVFIYEGARWRELSLGLVAEDIRFLALDKEDNLYAACDKGLFKADCQSYAKRGHSENMSFYYEGEPDIASVQKAAITYAEVEPEKIIRWRKDAARRAILPKVTAGIDRDTGDLWHWESGSTTKTGDDVLVRGRETIGWDLTLTWDLSELIWSDDQTSIDVRSRLMVQLRDDILDEVTKLYFERIRVKMELDGLAIEERKKGMEKELRLKELTASLDGLTGGYFSRCLAK